MTEAAAQPDPLHLAQQGIRLREQGAFEAARAIFAELTERFPQRVYGWQELGVLHAMRGDPEEALRLFAEAVRVDPTDLQPRRHLVLHLARLGRSEDAMAALGAHPGGASGEIALLAQFAGFLHEFPEHRALQLAAQVETGGRYLSPEAVERRIRTAIVDGAPLSLIRLGDGEGAWLPVSEADEARYRLIHETNRRAMLGIWFGGDAAYGSPSFLATQRGLQASVARADVVGVPFGLRLAHEYRIGSLRGVTACVNILRRLEQPGLTGAHTAFCSQDIHLDLHQRGGFARLLRLPVPVGVVSCHPDLGLRLARLHGARVTRMLVVPEEQGFAGVDAGLSSITGVSGMTEPHFPFAYHRLREALRTQAGQARLWLVAAGYLGKLYCDVLREAGAVALDIGSIVDGWCGAVTRPYLRAIAEFAL